MEKITAWMELGAERRETEFEIEEVSANPEVDGLRVGAQRSDSEPLGPRPVKSGRRLTNSEIDHILWTWVFHVLRWGYAGPGVEFDSRRDRSLYHDSRLVPTSVGGQGAEKASSVDVWVQLGVERREARLQLPHHEDGAKMEEIWTALDGQNGTAMSQAKRFEGYVLLWMVYLFGWGYSHPDGGSETYSYMGPCEETGYPLIDKPLLNTSYILRGPARPAELWPALVEAHKIQRINGAPGEPTALIDHGEVGRGPLPPSP